MLLSITKVWERSEHGFRGFRGCGSVWLPMAPGLHDVDVSLWKPTSSGLEGLSGTWLLNFLFALIPIVLKTTFFSNKHYAEELIPSIPDLAALRELTMSPFLRSQIHTASVGSLQLTVSTILAGFTPYGVETC